MVEVAFFIATRIAAPPLSADALPLIKNAAALSL